MFRIEKCMISGNYKYFLDEIGVEKIGDKVNETLKNINVFESYNEALRALNAVRELSKSGKYYPLIQSNREKKQEI